MSCKQFLSWTHTDWTSSFRYHFRGQAQEQVLYGGTVVGESAMLSEDDIGSEVKHIYVVSLTTTVCCCITSI